MNTQDKAKRLTAVSAHLFRDMMATLQPPGVVTAPSAETRRTHCCFPDYQEDEEMFGGARTDFVRSLSAETCWLGRTVRDGTLKAKVSVSRQQPVIQRDCRQVRQHSLSF